MKGGSHHLVALSVVTALVWTSAVAAADVSVAVDATSPSHSISPRLYGIFFEDINFAGDGGLNAELVKNGTFEFPQPLMGWTAVAQDRAQGTLRVIDDDPANPRNPHFLRLQASDSDNSIGVSNE